MSRSEPPPESTAATQPNGMALPEIQEVLLLNDRPIPIQITPKEQHSSPLDEQRFETVLQRARRIMNRGYHL